MSKLYIPGREPETKKQSFGFPPGIMRVALQSAQRAKDSAEMPAANRAGKRKRRLAAKKARRKNR